MSRCQTRCHDLDSINNYLFSEPSAYDPIGYVLHQLALLLAIDPHPAKEKSIGLSIRQLIVFNLLKNKTDINRDQNLISKYRRSGAILHRAAQRD